MNRILVVEDEEVIQRAIQRLLERNGYEVVACSTVEDARDNHIHSFDLVLADLRLPGSEGTDIIEEADPVPVVIMTSHASVRSAVQSMKLGAIDYISKPFDHDELLLVIERSLRHNRLHAQNRAMKQDLRRIFPIDDIIGQSATMEGIIQQISTLDDGQRHVFLYGERGTGKELLARLAHEKSERSAAPLVFADLPTYDFAELTPLMLGSEWPNYQSDGVPRAGLIQSAHNGTLVIRNFDFLPLETQNLLADVLERNHPGLASLNSLSKQRQVNVRVIAMNLSSLDDAVETGLISPRIQKLFRDNSFEVPPLRSRREDLLSLSEHYCELYVRRYRKRNIQLSTSSIEAIEKGRWIGNVKELSSAIERAVLLCDSDEIQPTQLGLLDDGDIEAVTHLSLDDYFRYFVQRYQHKLSETDLAGRLGISRKALWERRQRMDLPRPRPTPP